MMKNLSIVLTAIGGSGLLYIGFQIILDMTGDLVRYSYKLPLTHHEAANLIFLGVNLMLVITGVVGMLKKREKEDKGMMR
jgi:hypothetical protein